MRTYGLIESVAICNQVLKGCGHRYMDPICINGDAIGTDLHVSLSQQAESTEVRIAGQVMS
eukprot:scaffold38_cov415-Prasinococcus_capsulatus_cf.AAC.8